MELYSTIAEFVLPRLKEFKKRNIAIKGCFYDYHSYDNSESQINRDKLAKKRWNKELDKMINAFELLVLGDDFYDDKKFQKQVIKKIGDDIFQSRDSLRNYRDKIVTKGLKSFSKYFECLWF